MTETAQGVRRVEGDGRDTHDARQCALGPLGKGETLHLEQTADGGYLGYCHSGRTPSRAYGGAVMAQALAAAVRSVEQERPVHSLHAYFLRPVASERPAHFVPSVLRDGRSYSARQIAVVQDGRQAFTMTVSFKSPQAPGTWRHPVMPEVPGPEGLADGFAPRPASHPLRRSVEYREVPPVLDPRAPEIERFGWFRSVGALPDDPAAHACAVTYFCDATLSPTVLLPYEPTPRPRDARSPHTIASLDHAMWFHRPCRADQWLLYAQRSRVAGDGRALTYGEIWTRDGWLVASVAQEALVHVRE